MRGCIPFGEKEESPREKRSFNETKEETNQERASEIVRGASYGAADIQILVNIEGDDCDPPDYTPNHHARW